MGTHFFLDTTLPIMRAEGCCYNIQSRGSPSERSRWKSQTSGHRRWRHPIFLQASTLGICCQQHWDTQWWLPEQEQGKAICVSVFHLFILRNSVTCWGSLPWRWQWGSSSLAATSPVGTSGRLWASGLELVAWCPTWRYSGFWALTQKLVKTGKEFAI